MDVSYVVVFYFLGAVAVGYFVFKEIQEPSYMLNRNKRLGPTYWGVYDGIISSEKEDLRTIVPPPSSEHNKADLVDRAVEGKP